MKLTTEEQRALRRLTRALEDLEDLGAESVGRIADHGGEHGTDADSVIVDAITSECLRTVVISFN